ncbi:MAG: TolB family protein, partial [Bacteroidales bacterium]
MVCSAPLLTGCSGSGTDGSAAPDPLLTPAEIAGGRVTPEILWKFARLGEVRCAPDQSTLLFAVTRYNLEENSGKKQLYTLPVAGGNPVALMPVEGAYSNPRWHPVNGKIWYLNDVNGENQLFEMNPDGSESKQISSITGGVSGFEIDPSGKRILYLKRVKMLPD